MPKRVGATGLVQTELLHGKTAGIDTDRDYLAVGFFDTASSRVIMEERPQTHQGHRDLAIRCTALGSELTVIESSGQFHLAAVVRQAHHEGKSA